MNYTAIIIVAIVVAGIVALAFKFGCRHKWTEKRCAIMACRRDRTMYNGIHRGNTVQFTRHTLCCERCGKLKFVDEPYPDMD